MLIVALLGLAVLLLMGAGAYADAAGRKRAADDRASISAHWEALVMQRADLRLAVDAAGVPTLHGRAGGFGYAIRLHEGGGPWAGRPWASAAAVTATSGITLCRRDGEGAPVPGLRDGIETGDADFDAVFEVRCDDAEAARARLAHDVRAAMLTLPGAYACLDEDGLRIDLGTSATAIDHALLDSLGEVLVALGRAAPPAVAAG